VRTFTALAKGTGYFLGSMVPRWSRPAGSYRSYIAFRQECYGKGAPSRGEVAQYLRWIASERRSWVSGSAG